MTKAQKSKPSSSTTTKSSATAKHHQPIILPQARPKPHTKIQCWAHSRTGIRCTSLIASREGEPIPIPYCARHLESGDGALKVVSHPFAGKALVARYDLPAKYRLAYWGRRGKCATSDKEDRAISYYPPNAVTGRNTDPKVDGGRTLKTNNYNGVLNPENTGDIVQFAACPGPNERQNMRSTFQYFGKRNGDIGGLEFVTLMAVPKNTQLLHWYGSDWWKMRGVKRCDVGTGRYPATKRVPKVDTNQELKEEADGEVIKGALCGETVEIEINHIKSELMR
ncbi:hypothetical protein ACHAWO_006639 [Cyclotella atomus]|uniref:SET domain-containing protein n=1 Tax=Cyclotella atomus TaxID=382360 RepID=A0ABD3Q9J7_9STRA